MSCNNIITITRQYGSGGHNIGKALSERLGIPFYDKELISLAAKESGISPEVFENVDEKATNSLLYSLSLGLYNYGNGFSSMGDLPVNDKLYILQHKIIKQLANEGPCVFVGRCADYVLKDHQNLAKIYIYADIDVRTKRAVEDKVLIPLVQAGSIKSRQKQSKLLQFLFRKKWGLADNYDLCINSTALSTEQAVDIICEYLNIINK